MSGHSHWHKVRYKKGVADAQKGKVFSKMARLIAVAAREGSDPEKNSKLRLAIEKAKSLNMPNENIERAVKRGSGELEGRELQEVLFEAYGPGNAAIIIEGITDNRNRTLNEVKHILSEHGGKLAGEGSVKWLFEQKGVITINPEEQSPEFQKKEELELKIIDAGADDFRWEEGVLEICIDPKRLQEVKNTLIDQGIKVESVSLDWVAKEEISVSEKEKESAEKLFLALDENDDIQEIYSNLQA